MPDTMMQPEAPAYENRSASLAKLAEALCKAQGVRMVPHNVASCTRVYPDAGSVDTS